MASTGANVIPRPDDDFWFQGRGFQTATGLRISPESAMRCAAVFACVRVISETVASLPLIVYRNLPNGGKERAYNHPLYPVLHNKPNPWQTSFEWLEMMQAHLELRGNAFSRITSTPTKPIEWLIPIHPDRVNVWRLTNGALQYQVFNQFTGENEWYLQNEIMHLRGMSSDGLIGMSTVAVGAEPIACGLAAQEFAGRFFENDSTPSGVMIHPKQLSDGAHARIKKSWEEMHAKSKAHSVALLEEGMTYETIGMTNKDSQLIEARQFSRGDIASLFRVPPHKIGDLSRATFSNIEQQNIEFATDSVRPRLVRLERRINNDVISMLDLNDGQTYFAEFLMDALLRGDLKSRYEAYSTAINAGFLTRADARAAENYNPLPGLEKPLMPLNMVPIDENGDPEEPANVVPADATGVGAARLKLFINSAADRIISKEIYKLRRILSRSQSIQDFHHEMREVYDGHGEHVMSIMHVSLFAAKYYIQQRIGVFSACTTLEEAKIAVDWHEGEGSQTLQDIAARELAATTPRKVRKQEEFNAPVGAAEVSE